MTLLPSSRTICIDPEDYGKIWLETYLSHNRYKLYTYLETTAGGSLLGHKRNYNMFLYCYIQRSLWKTLKKIE